MKTEGEIAAAVEQVMHAEGWTCDPSAHDHVPNPGECINCDGRRHTLGVKVYAALNTIGALGDGFCKVLDEPDEPGHVAFEIEVVPHDSANDGMGWHKGRDTPARVAQILRDYAAQVETFTPPNPPRDRALTKAEQDVIFAEKFRERPASLGCGAVWEDSTCDENDGHDGPHRNAFGTWGESGP